MPIYREIDTKGKTKVFPWVTDLPLGRDTVMPIMRAARRRRAIGNETFRILEARDAYGFEHDLGHGGNHLADAFVMPAFPIDRVQRHCRPPFRKAHDHRQRSLFRTSVIRDRRTLYLAMAGNTGKPEPAELLQGGPWPARPAALEQCRSCPAPHPPDTGRQTARPVVVCARNGIAGRSRTNGRPPPDHHPTGNCCGITLTRDSVRPEKLASRPE